MGLDLRLFTKDVLTAEEFVRANKFIKARLGEPDDIFDGWLEFKDHDNTVEFSTLSRYYGPGYERGDWPTIYSYVRLMQAALPDHVLYYSSDAGSKDDAQEVTSVFLEDMWKHYLGPKGRAYYANWNSNV